MASFGIPSGAAANISIIDSSMRMHGLPTEMMLTPKLNGFEKFPPLATWSFLIQSSSGRKVLFDLGCHCDAATRPPLIQKQVEATQVKLEVERDVADILKEHGINPSEVDSVVWSHWHFDHVGNMTTFPASTELVVGPGFMDAYAPGYPTHADSHILEAYLKDRKVQEIRFEQRDALRIGAFRAVDFFGDGSFYLLDAPGHCTGHLAGLVRTTTNPDTFILLGADLSHHGGELRPSPYVPIPNALELSVHNTRPVFSGANFRSLNVKRGRKEDEPFFDPVFADDIPQAIETIKAAQVADARDDVFVVFAHDMSIEGVVDLFPQSANQWKEKGWKEKTYWKFLEDFVPGIET